MPKFIDLTGQKFGRLLVLYKQSVNKQGQICWVCQCDCGNTNIVSSSDLNSGHTKSCGCLKRDLTIQRNTTHRMSKTRIYGAWVDMLNRCRNKSRSSYKDYGARGITVCNRWLKFENFYADMGECPKGLTIERKNNDLGYSPDNCIYATRKEQANNKRNNVVIEYRGYTLSMKEWAKKIGINYRTLAARIETGWSTEKALTQLPKEE